MKKKILFGFAAVLIVWVGVYALPYWVDCEVSKRLNLIERCGYKLKTKLLQAFILLRLFGRSFCFI